MIDIFIDMLYRKVQASCGVVWYQPKVKGAYIFHVAVDKFMTLTLGLRKIPALVDSTTLALVSQIHVCMSFL